MEKVLVTGGAGFIGSHVVEDLLKLGYDVVALDDLSGGFKRNIPVGVKFIEMDICDYTGLRELFENEKFDYVFHLAAYAAEGLSHFIRRFNYSNNLLGSVNLINLSVLFKIKRFVFTSSIAVYGSNQLPFSESTVPQPEDPYGIAKYAVELDLKAAHEMFGLEYTIFRPHNVYGERQNIADKYRNVIGIFMNNILGEKELPIFGDGNQTRAFTYVKDVSRPIAASVSKGECRNETYNIGADKPYTINELVEVISSKLNKNLKVKYFPARNEVVHAYSTHEKANRTFYSEIKSIALEDGISIMADDALKNKYEQTKNFTGIEIYENLPTAWLENK